MKQPFLNRLADEFSPIMNPQFAHNVAPVRANGMQGQAQVSRQCPIVHSIANQTQDFQLPGGQFFCRCSIRALFKNLP